MTTSTAAALMPRNDFIGLEHSIHLAAHAEGPCLKAGAAALARFALAKTGAEPLIDGRPAGHHAVYEACRSRLSRLLGCDVEDLAFVPSVADGTRLIAQSLPWRPGDSVVLEDVEFPSLLYPWLALRERGVEVRLVRSQRGIVDATDLAAAVDANTRVLAVSLVSFLTGRRHDLTSLMAIARQHGARLVVDASHALGVLPVEAAGCDFLLSCTYKWLLGAQGAAVLYWNRSVAPEFSPSVGGWFAVDHPFDDGPVPTSLEPASRAGAGRCEAGNPAFPSLYILNEGLGSLLDIGLERIGAHALRLAGRVRDGLARLGLEVLTPELARERAAMIRCRVSDSAALQVALAARGVKVGGLGGCLTMATHAYNSEQDVETALAILAEVLA